MAEKLGRALTPEEIVHHVDGNKLNNEETNLQVMSKIEHDDLHRPAFIAKAREHNLGTKQSPEVVARRAAALVGNKSRMGQKHTPEQRAKISAALKGNLSRKGQKQSPDEIAKRVASRYHNQALRAGLT